jgi:hypothetical protein
VAARVIGEPDARSVVCGHVEVRCERAFGEHSWTIARRYLIRVIQSCSSPWRSSLS